MKRWTILVLVCAVAFWVAAQPAHASAPTGAIFTTVFDGSEVNLNNYPSKEAVYLDGGPGPGAPQTAAGLDDGIYVFQVTDPSGKMLLSTDKAKCRQFSVLNGIITGYITVAGCTPHGTGTDIDHGATTIQLMPYLDTPNPGGVYKAWATKVQDYLTGCSNLNVSNGLDVVDCGGPRSGDFHGFLNSSSKTDNFKVDTPIEKEIDTYFTDRNGAPIDGLLVPHIDSLGATNNYWTYTNTGIGLFHASHVENVETGTHYILIQDSATCKVGNISVLMWNGNSYYYYGAQALQFKVGRDYWMGTIKITVSCQ